MKKQTVPTLRTEWNFENYSYIANFLLENENKVKFTLKKDQIEKIKPEYLFKLYKLNDDNLDSLKEGYFFMSHPSNFNDPFDCLVNREKSFRAHKPSDSKILKHRRGIGVSSFTLVKDNPLMWGHYGDSFKGFGVKFNFKSLFHNQQLYLRSHISYLKNYKMSSQISSFNKLINEIKQFDIDEDSKDFMQKLLVINYEYMWKYHQWGYEQEYRLITFESDEIKRKLLFNKKDIEEFYIGFRMEKFMPERYLELKKIIKENYPKAKIFTVFPNGLEVKLDFKEE